MQDIKARALQSAALSPVAFAADKAAEYYGAHSRHGFTNKEIGNALDILMSGPKATRPTWRAVRKTILRIRKGLSVAKAGWRRWPHMGEVHNAI